MGDILYDATGWRHWLAEHLCALGITIDYPMLVEGWESALVPVYLGQKNYWDAFTGFIEQLGVTPSDIEPIRSLAEEQGRAFSKSHAAFPGVAEGLAELKEHDLRLAVLSDTESTQSRVHEKLKRLGLDSYFDAVVTSFDIKAVKPMPQAFDAGLTAIGAVKQSSAFVGHDMDELQGSTEFGLYSIAYNYTPLAPADYHAETFAEVVRTLLTKQG